MMSEKTLWGRREHDNDLAEHYFRSRGRELIQGTIVIATLDTPAHAKWVRHRLNRLDSERSLLIEEFDALTSERDEAVRVAGELRAKAANIRPYLRRPAAIVPANLSDDERWRFNAEWVSIYDYRELLAALDSLTASTGGSSDEPQKEIRE